MGVHGFVWVLVIHGILVFVVPGRLSVFGWGNVALLSVRFRPPFLNRHRREELFTESAGCDLEFAKGRCTFIVDSVDLGWVRCFYFPLAHTQTHLSKRRNGRQVNIPS